MINRNELRKWVTEWILNHPEDLGDVELRFEMLCYAKNITPKQAYDLLTVGAENITKTKH